MKRNLLLAIIIAVIFIVTGCGYESTTEYELLTIRLCTYKDESGLFTTKTKEFTNIEVSYQTPDGIMTETCSSDRVKVSEETKVVKEEGDISITIYLTPEAYNELYGLNYRFIE